MDCNHHARIHIEEKHRKTVELKYGVFLLSAYLPNLFGTFVEREYY
jgi:hypothetical protein